ncbi:LOW QUALITY PROTEIN: sodium-coupled neutral amino acid transporter 5 [Rhynchocyon petersi]
MGTTKASEFANDSEGGEEGINPCELWTCGPYGLVLFPYISYTVPIITFAFICHSEMLPMYMELCCIKPEIRHMYSQKDLLILCALAMLLAMTLIVLVVLFLQLLFPKAFSWLWHMAIVLALFVLVNALVISVPTIQDMFRVRSTSAPSLIFILPRIFYLHIVPSEVEPHCPWPTIQVLGFGALGFIFMVISLGFMLAS